MRGLVNRFLGHVKELINNRRARYIKPKLIERRWQNTLYPKFRQHYGDFRSDEDYREYAIVNLPKESGQIRGEIVKAIRDLPDPVCRVLLPGERNAVKFAYADLFRLDEKHIVTAGLEDDVDFPWNFEEDPPDFGKFNCIVSQAMLEHLIDPYKHVRDLAEALEQGGYLILHTVVPGFPYHRFPIDCLRFFPDWFEEISKKLRLEICDKYIGQLRILYSLRKIGLK
jgi:SAM-dependent methyltransferase